jgi:NitT/TauT family transport system substrate-binding protein
MNRRRLLGILVVSVLVALAIVVWVLTRPEPPGPQAVRFGYLPIASDASFFVALDRGFFSAEGLQVEPIKFETSNQALEALVAGRIDATAIVALEAALALEVNTPGQFRIIEMTAATEKTRVHRIMVKPDSPIKTLAELKGKKVGTFPGSQMVVFLKLILSRYFDADREVEIIQLKAQLQPQALETGQVDALFCLEPTCTLLEARGLGRSISINPLYEFIQKPFPTAVGVVSSRLANERPEVVQKIAAALRSAHEYIRTQPEEASRSVPKYAPIEADLAPRISVYDYWGLEAIDRGAVQRLADLYAEKGVLTKRVSTEPLYGNLKK